MVSTVVGERFTIEVQLRALIARLVAATEGSRELDGEIAATLKLYPEGAFRMLDIADNAYFATGAYERWEAPRYTTSLDAALTLVPSETWRVYAIQEHYVGPPVTWFVGLDRRRCHVRSMMGHAPTAPLALCIAALKAHAEDR
jgi:hypothetical protein